MEVLIFFTNALTRNANCIYLNMNILDEYKSLILPKQINLPTY